MADKHYLLSQDDRDALDKLIAQGRISGPPQRSRGGRDDGWGGDGPQIYLCRVPHGGIAAVTDAVPTGTGSESAPGDVPGYADCYVYRTLRTDGEGGTPYAARVGNLRITVHNYTKYAIPGGMWVTAVRDGWGFWYVPAPGMDFGAC